MEDERLTQLEQQVQEILSEYREKFVGKLVRLKSGKYTNRIARIDGVIFWNNELQFLCMVLRADGNGVLNTEADTRRYRPREDFEFFIK